MESILEHCIVYARKRPLPESQCPCHPHAALTLCCSPQPHPHSHPHSTKRAGMKADLPKETPDLQPSLFRQGQCPPGASGPDVVLAGLHQEPHRSGPILHRHPGMADSPRAHFLPPHLSAAGHPAQMVCTAGPCVTAALAMQTPHRGVLANAVMGMHLTRFMLTSWVLLLGDSDAHGPGEPHVKTRGVSCHPSLRGATWRRRQLTRCQPWNVP